MDRLPPVCENHQNAYQGVLDAKNAILEQYLLGRDQQALEWYKALEQPTAEDHLWAAQCLLALDRPVEALQRNVKARTLGLEDAGAYEALCLCVMGEVDRAEHTLDLLEPDRLSSFGRAVMNRQRGTIALMRGQYPQALPLFERAWALAERDVLGSRMLASFTGSLAFTLSKLGRDALALQYLNRALEDATKSQRPRLLSLRILAHLYSGALLAARLDLETLERTEAEQQTQTVSVTHRQYLRGLLARAQGLPSEAIQHWTASAARAKSTAEQEFEFYAVLNLAAVHTGLEQPNEARALLSRARTLAQNLQQHALLGLRHGALLARLSDPELMRESILVLETTLQAFEDLTLEREVGLTHLHVAEAHFRLDQTCSDQTCPDHVQRGLEHLSRAVDARHALGSGAAFAIELHNLPVTLEVLHTQAPGSYLTALLEDVRALEPDVAYLIEICSLGQYGIRMNGRSLKLEHGASRTVEMIAFLLERKQATLEELQTNIFDGVSVARARNHIHVIRHSLAKVLPGVSVPFEPVSKTYRLSHPGLRLTWDVLEVKRSLVSQTEFGTRQALRQYSGAFLPDAESDWASEYRRDLEWRVVSSGLRTVEDLFARNRFEACVDLAERLLELTPTNEGLAVMLVRSLRELHGVLVARARLEGLKQAFSLQVGEVPAALVELDRQAWMTAN
jgi:tetratricopeptide (TPR) repeat protein